MLAIIFRYIYKYSSQQPDLIPLLQTPTPYIPYIFLVNPNYRFFIRKMLLPLPPDASLPIVDVHFSLYFINYRFYVCFKSVWMAKVINLLFTYYQLINLNYWFNSKVQELTCYMFFCSQSTSLHLVVVSTCSRRLFQEKVSKALLVTSNDS